MKDLFLKYGAVVLALLATYLITKHLTDEYWKEKIANAPVVWTKPDTGKPILIEQPKQRDSTIVKKKPTTAPRRSEITTNNPDSLKNVIQAQQMEIDWLRLEVTSSWRDSLGGLHEKSYEPETGLFGEVFTPPPKIVLPITNFGTKTVLDEQKDLVWILLKVGYFDGPTYGGMIFIDRIGAGATKISDGWLYEAGVKIPIL